MVEGINKLIIKNGNPKRDFVLNSLASNAPITRKGEMKKITLFIMKFEIVDVCQNAWFKCHRI